MFLFLGITRIKSECMHEHIHHVRTLMNVHVRHVRRSSMLITVVDLHPQSLSLSRTSWYQCHSVRTRNIHSHEVHLY